MLNLMFPWPRVNENPYGARILEYMSSASSKGNQWRTQDFSKGGGFEKWHQKFVRDLYFGK